MKLLLPLFFVFNYSLFGQVNYESENILLLDNWQDSSLYANFYSAKYNEVWGFTRDGVEYAVIGSTEGIHVFKIESNDTLNLIWEDRVTSPSASNVIHRDFHDLNNYLYAGCAERSWLYRFDLSYLPDSLHRDTVFNLHAIHNLFIDTAASVIYLDNDFLGTSSKYEIFPNGDINETSLLDLPFYAHDFFARNDTLFANCGHEGLLVIDYNVSTPIYSSLEFYSDKGYNHSGWLSNDGLIYAFADETAGKRIKICDASDLTDIEVLSMIDIPYYDNLVVHNLLMKDSFLYVSYYEAGLQIFDISDPSFPQRVAYFDTYQPANQGSYYGAWGVFPFLTDDKILVSDMQSGLFLLKLETDYLIDSSDSQQQCTISIKNSIVENDGLLYLSVSNLDFPALGRVYDMKGSIVSSVLIGTGVNSISLNEIASGAYIIQFYLYDKILGIEKFFKK